MTLEAAVKEAVRIATKRHEKAKEDVELIGLYTFAGPGKADVVWIDRHRDGTWSVRK